MSVRTTRAIRAGSVLYALGHLVRLHALTGFLDMRLDYDVGLTLAGDVVGLANLEYWGYDLAGVPLVGEEPTVSKQRGIIDQPVGQTTRMRYPPTGKEGSR